MSLLYTINLGSMIRRTAHKEPGLAALVSHEGTPLTYGELDRLSNCFADSLIRMGFGKGDHLATLALNCNELLIAFFGIFKMGGLMVPINVRLAPLEMAWILDHSETSALVYSRDFEKTVGAIRPRLPKVRSFMMFEEPASPETAGFQAILQEGKDEFPSLEILGDDEAMIVYTAGTTGRPKGVLLTHNSIIWNCINWAHTGTFRSGDRVLQVFPLYHVAAIGNVFTNFYLGATIYLKKIFDPKDCLETIQREKITRWGAAPTVFNMLLQTPEVDRYETNSVTLLGSGAAIMPVETSRRLKEIFPKARIFDNYGMTEASGGITTLSPEDSPRKTACVGQPLICLEMRVINEQGEDQAPGEIGEVVFRGNNLMKSYYKDSEATEEAIRGGWMHTGDLGRLDEEGFLYIVDRKKDMIITGAENVFPREVEEILYLHPKIAEAAVIGVPDPKWGEAIKAVVTLKAGESASPEEIIGFCRQQIAGFKCPKSVDFIEALPKNPAGKILKRVLREQYGKSVTY